MTPVQINVLLYYYYCAHRSTCDEVAGYDDWGSPAVCEAICRLVSDNLLRVSDEGGYEITERGRVYVEEGLMRVPLPQCTWLIPKD